MKSSPRIAVCLWCLLLLVEPFRRCHALATTNPNSATKKGYRVCTASPCGPNGSELLLDALQRLATDGTTLKGDYCLGGCCSGTVVKPIGKTNSHRKMLPVIADQETAMETAETLLLELDALDESKLQTLRDKMAAGDRVLENSNEPDICQNCGVGLQLYRGNCAKCGKYPY
ncbi:expressed unknown protein [Seminavis robusta]|uniref:Secreted protein n=1 Tax=Seminavis robusta TaxID=568900 RepID=A0A9N8EVT3_9STRA|nr:expressed unknown protein [Seminavis robusta]|eukprot:Sro1836_g300690.1 n/a (172) ;mRNA; f:14951-15466